MNAQNDHPDKNKSEDSLNLLAIIRKRSHDGERIIRLRDILDELPEGRGQLLKQLFRLFEQGKVNTVVNHREREEIHVTYANKDEDGEAKAAENDPLKKMIGRFMMYCNFSQKPSIREFHQITDHHYRKLALFSFMNSARINITEIRIFLSVVNGFISGTHPACLNEMGLSAQDLAFYSEQFINQSNTLTRENLVNNHIDPDGVSCRLSLTKRSLQLLQNKTLSMQKVPKKYQSRLFIYKPAESIQDKKMYYNTTTDGLFNHLCGMIVHTHTTDIRLPVLLYGPSGSGKTEFAYQLAKRVQGDIVQLDFTQVHSKWIGEAEKNIRSAFYEYREISSHAKQPVILLLNEADGLMNRRVSIMTSNDAYANQTQAQLLEELENFKGVLIATTNMYQNIDVAFYRRFLYRCKIELPDYSVREKLLNESPLLCNLPSHIKTRVLRSDWTAAQLRNLEYKLEQFAGMIQNNEAALIELLTEEGMLDTSKIGF